MPQRVNIEINMCIDECLLSNDYHLSLAYHVCSFFIVSLPTWASNITLKGIYVLSCEDYPV